MTETAAAWRRIHVFYCWRRATWRSRAKTVTRHASCRVFNLTSSPRQLPVKLCYGQRGYVRVVNVSHICWTLNGLFWCRILKFMSVLTFFEMCGPIFVIYVMSNMSYHNLFICAVLKLWENAAVKFVKYKLWNILWHHIIKILPICSVYIYKTDYDIK